MKSAAALCEIPRVEDALEDSDWLKHQLDTARLREPRLAVEDARRMAFFLVARCGSVSSEHPPGQAASVIHTTIGSAATGDWLREALTWAMRRDPLDAARDAGHLLGVLSSWAERGMS